MAQTIHGTRHREFSHRHGMALALDGDGRGGSQYVSECARSDARISRSEVHHVLGANLRMDAGKISESLRADTAAGKRRSLGGSWRHVGRARFEYAGRRVAGATDSGG